MKQVDTMLDLRSRCEGHAYTDGPCIYCKAADEIARLRVALEKIAQDDPRKCVSSPNGSQAQFLDGMSTQWRAHKEIAQQALQARGV